MNLNTGIINGVYHVNLVLECHAEVNAVLNKNTFDVSGCTLHVTIFPCNECAKVIIQAGIKKIIYASDKHKDRPSILASKKMLDMAGIIYR